MFEEVDCESKTRIVRHSRGGGRGGWEQEGYTRTCSQEKCWEIREGSTCWYVQW